jgi:CubicO group peptidase (beta-lactamase class C family)
MTTSRRSVLGLLGMAPLVAGGLVTASGSGYAGTDSVPAELRPGGALDRFAADLAARDEFSGALLLTCRGRTVLTRSYGMANKALSISNRPDTIFALASVTKLFTAVSLAQLAQHGKVAYHEKLGTYLDGFPAEIANTVTVHHLLTHTSGFGDHLRMPGFWATAATWASADEVMDGTMAFIRRSELSFPPGSETRYSNSGYHLLGAIVAKVSGQSYYDYVREHIFGPAGMRSTDFYTSARWRDDRRFARPYKKQPSGERTDDIAGKVFLGTPAGDAFSTCVDMDRFAHALLGEKLLLNSAYSQLTLGEKVPMPPQAPPGSPAPPAGTASPPAVFQCYGPQAFLTNNRRALGHTGGAPGESTEIQWYPGSRWVSVILSNYDIGTVAPIAALARRLITEAPPTP